MGDLTNEELAFTQTQLVDTDCVVIYLSKREVGKLMDMAERCAKAEKAAGELLRAARITAFEGLTTHQDKQRLIPSEKLRESLVNLRAACLEAERAGVKP